MKRAAYTLIELVIAVAIVVIVLSVGIPRYSGYLRQSRFNSEVQKVSQCIQAAQVAVAAPDDSSGTPARYGRASVAISGGAVIGCAESLYPSGLTGVATDGKPQPTALTPVKPAQNAAVPSGLVLCSMRLDGSATSTAVDPSWTSLDLYFDRLTQGTLWNLAYGGSGTGATVLGPMPGFGQGHQVQLLFSEKASDCTTTADGTSKAILTVPRSGTPITLTTL